MQNSETGSDSGAMEDQNPHSPPPPDGVRSEPAPPDPAVVNQPPSSFPVSSIPASTGTPMADKKDNNEKEGNISKDAIGPPTDFRHVEHVGWDAEKEAVDVDKLDSDMKDFFGDIGISLSQLKDTETATFIYNFIEQHGGIQAIKEERQQRGAGRPPSPVPSMQVKRGDSGAMEDQNDGVRSEPASPPPAVVSQPPSSTPVSNNPASTGTPKADRKTKKGKITKDDIGPPTDFRHLQHVGWDPEKGAFDVDKLDADMKEFFGHAHVSPFQLQDSETAMFIYNFIEEHGGIQAIKEEQQQRAARPPPPPVPSMPVVVQEPTQVPQLTTDGDTASHHVIALSETEEGEYDYSETDKDNDKGGEAIQSASLVHETNHGDEKMKRDPNLGPFLTDIATTTTSDLEDSTRHPVVQFSVVLRYTISAFITWPKTPGDCSSPRAGERKALGYRLRYRRADETGEYMTRSLSENLVLIENLAPNTKYRYQVKYVLENEGETPWSRENELDTSHGQTKDQAVSMSY